MGEAEQDRPLAPAALRSSSDALRPSSAADENGDFSSEYSKKKLRRRRCLMCGGCCAATTVIIVVVILILAFTVFKVKDPEMKFNFVKIEGLDLARRQGTLSPGVNMSFIYDIAIKNPNAASFKFNNATTSLYYGGLSIGDVQSPPGNARAGKTFHMNVTIDVMVDTLMKVSTFNSDIASGQMQVDSFTDIAGRVKIINIIKKHIDIKMNCTMTIVISTQTITEKNCKRTVKM